MEEAADHKLLEPRIFWDCLGGIQMFIVARFSGVSENWVHHGTPMKFSVNPPFFDVMLKMPSTATPQKDRGS